MTGRSFSELLTSSDDPLRGFKPVIVTAFARSKAASGAVQQLSSYIDLNDVGAAPILSTSSTGGSYDRNGSLQADKLNQVSLVHFKELQQIVASDNIEYGFESRSDIYIRSLVDKYGNDVGPILQCMGLSSAVHPDVFIALLKGISHIPYHRIFPMAQYVAIAAMVNQDVGVREAGIRAFEKWEDPSAAEILRPLQMSIGWLEDYKTETIEFLESL